MAAASSSHYSWNSSSKASELFTDSNVGKVAGYLSFIGFQLLKAPMPTLLNRVVLLVEFLQLISFALHPPLFYGGFRGLDIFFEAIARSRDPTAGKAIPAVTIAMLVYGCILFVTFATQFVFVARGGAGYRWLCLIIRYFEDLSRILLVPSKYILVHAIIDVQSEATLRILCGVILGPLVVVELVLVFLAQAEIRPSTSRVCAMRPTAPLLHCVAKLVVVGIDIGVSQRFPAWGPTVYGVAGLMAFLLILLNTAIFFPEVMIASTFTLGAIIGACSWGFVMAIASSASHLPVFRKAIGIIAVVGLPIGGVIAVLLLKLRASKRGLRVAVPFAEKAPSITAMFPNAISYDIASRFVYSHLGKNDAASISKAEAILQEGLHQFPESHYMKLCMATFLLDVKRDLQSLRHLFRNMGDRRPSVDIALKLFYIVKSIPRTSEELNDIDELELSLANKHARQAKKALLDFWSDLSKKRRVFGTPLLIHAASSLDDHQRKADALFKSVLARHPKSKVVMRQFARYLAEVKDESEQAEMLFQEADLEEASTREKEPGPVVRMEEDTVVDVDPELPNRVPSKVDFTADRDGEETSDRRSAGMSVGDLSSLAGSAFTPVAADRAKAMQFRSRITEAQRTASAKFRLLSGIQIVNLVILILVIFLVSQKFLTDVKKVVTSEHNTMLAARLASRAPLELRSLWHGENETRVKQASKRDSEEFIRNWWLAFNESTSAAGWNLNVTQKYYTAGSDIGTGTYETKNISLWDSGLLFTDSLTAITRDLENGLQLRELELQWRWVLDNHGQLSKGLQETLGYSTSSKTLATKKTAIILLCIIGAWVLGAGSLAALSIFLSAKDRANKVQTGLELFKEIPRSVCVNILEKIERTDQNIDEKASWEILDKSHISPGVQFALPLLTFFVALISVAGLIAALLWIYTPSVASNGILANLGMRGALVSEIQFLSTEAKMNDTFWKLETRNPEATIRTLIGTLFEIDRSLKFSLGQLKEDAELWLSSRDCPRELADIGITCRGITTLMNYFDAISLAVSSNNTLATPSMIHNSYTVFHVLDSWLLETLNSFASKSTATLDNILNLSGWLLAVAAVISFLFGAWYLSLVARIMTASATVMNLLLMVPMPVLEKIDAVRFFFDTSDAGVKTVKSVADDQARRVNVILQGCADAIIVTDEKGLVEVINAAAEALFGVSNTEFVGHSILDVLTDEEAKNLGDAIEEVVSNLRLGKRIAFPLGSQYETVVKNRGEGPATVVVLASTTMAYAADEVTFATFMKPITEIKEHQRELEAARKRADDLLLNILPESIAEELKTAGPGHIIAEKHQMVSIMFADIVNFTPMASKMEPYQLVMTLNELYSPWDALCGIMGVEKIKTIGDCFMCATGLPVEQPDHAERIIEFALAAMDEVEKFNAARRQRGQAAIQFRVGIHTGSVIAGVIGQRKWLYDIWGDSVNVASRLETASLPGRIQVSAATQSLVKDLYQFEPRGLIDLKGKGEVEAFMLVEGQHPRFKIPQFPGVSSFHGRGGKMSSSCSSRPSTVGSGILKSK